MLGDDLKKLRKENMALRQMLWLRHGCSYNSLYGDDGEMQCNNNACMIDFKRMPVPLIREILQRRNRT